VPNRSNSDQARDVQQSAANPFRQQADSRQSSADDADVEEMVWKGGYSPKAMIGSWRIEVIDIDDVSYTQGPVERIFGVGTIQLTSSDRSHPTLSMIGIGEVTEVAGLLDDIRRAERRRRSLHIESI